MFCRCRQVAASAASGPALRPLAMLLLLALLGLVLLVPRAQARLGSSAPLDAPAAQSVDGRLAHLQQLAQVGLDLKARLRAAAGGVQPVPRFLPLSSAGHQLISLGERLEGLKAAVGQAQASGLAAGEQDFVSRLGGMTQNEPSVAWCGASAVIGFNDSSSFARKLLGPISTSNNFSSLGWSRSADAGATFPTTGTLVPDPLPAGIAFRDLLGRPVVGCSSSTTFYYASFAIDSDPSGIATGVAISRSADGGQTWGGAVMAVRKSLGGHFLDSPWLAVAPGPTPGSDVLHVTYVDLDFTGAACPNRGFRMALEYVRSVDGGATWGAPVVIEAGCGFAALPEAPQVRAGLGNDVFVAWERFGLMGSREIRLSKSTDGGSSFGPAMVVGPVTPVGDGWRLQGQFRASFNLHGLAVDRSTGPHRGTVYLAWHDGRNLSRPDPLSFVQCQAAPVPGYCFGDILVARSVDGGATWLAPVRVNDDPITLAADQFMPALAVDPTGKVFAFFYDRRRDARNWWIDAYLASSTDGGLTWTNTQVTQTSFPPLTGWQDIFMSPSSLGEYVGIAADTTQENAGVVVAWADTSLGDANFQSARR
ncbi:MAG TPA: sialidase family protein [Chloroflexota bacterium]|nr:sialidase family protein [Chloroflexota bacterium]